MVIICFNGYKGVNMEYIEQILDIKIEYKDWEDRKKIPFFLTDRYSFKQAKLDETNCLFMHIKGENGRYSFSEKAYTKTC